MNLTTVKGGRVTVIVDAFRAFATACSILNQNPLVYFLTDQCSVVKRLKNRELDPVLIGKPEIDSSLHYTIPNSPTRVQELNLRDRTVIHRTTAGGVGVKRYKEADILLAVSFVNAKATAEAIAQINPSQLKVIPMGHEGKTPTLEDDLCASYLRALVEGKSFGFNLFIEELREGPGKCFFGADQNQYPREDFDQCLAFNTFGSPIFVENRGDFAILRTSGPVSLNASMSSMISRRIPSP